MAKKTPKTETSTIDKTNNATAQQVQKAAVNVDSKNESSKVKKSAKKTSDKPNFFQRISRGFKGVMSELKKVTWPKGKEVGKNTVVVLTVVVIFFVVLFAIDYVLGGLFGLTVNGKWATIFID